MDTQPIELVRAGFCPAYVRQACQPEGIHKKRQLSSRVNLERLTDIGEP